MSAESETDQLRRLYREETSKRVKAEDERDAAIAAKEAAELELEERRQQRTLCRLENDRMRPVVEAARTLMEKFPDDDTGMVNGVLNLSDVYAALRALDVANMAAGNERRLAEMKAEIATQGDAYRIGPAVCHHPRNCATCMAAQAIAREEIERLRSALARAEEKVTHWKEHAKAHEERGTWERDRCNEAERGLADAHDVMKRLRSELQTEKARREAVERGRDHFKYAVAARRTEEYRDVIERTAKAQRDLCCDYVGGRARGESAVEACEETPLVILSALPEVDSSGGGEGPRPQSTFWLSDGRRYGHDRGFYGCKNVYGWPRDHIAAEMASWPEETDDSWCGSDYCDQQCFPGLRRCWTHRDEDPRFDPAPPKSVAVQSCRCCYGSKLYKGDTCPDCNGTGEEPIVPAPDGGGEGKRPRRIKWDLLGGEPFPAAEPKAEAIDEFTDEFCNNAAAWTAINMKHDWVPAMVAIRRRNARIADQDAHIRKLTDRLSAHQREEQRLEERVRLLDGYLADAKTRCRELEAKLAEARKRESANE